MAIDDTPFDLIQKLRSWFFASDRDIRLQTGRHLITQDGTNVENALEAQFVTLALDGDLDNERVLTAGTGITLVDGGANGTITISQDPTAGVVPSGGVIFWPSTAGAIPSGWTTFAAGSGKFLVGTDAGTFTNGSTGGQETINIQHSHTSGTLATDSDSHSHTNGTLATDTDTHSHSVDSGATASDSHSHNSGTLASDSDSHDHGPGTLATSTVNHFHAIPAGVNIAAGSDYRNQTSSVGHGHSVAAGLTASDNHSHNIDSGATASDSHSHNSGTLATANDGHSHTVNSGSTASDNHSHAVDSGSTANALSTVQSVLNPYLVGTWIEKS
jgi:hypothetical protein